MDSLLRSRCSMQRIQLGKAFLAVDQDVHGTKAELVVTVERSCGLVEASSVIM